VPGSVRKSCPGLLLGLLHGGCCSRLGLLGLLLPVFSPFSLALSMVVGLGVATVQYFKFFRQLLM
jgi:hypothetical protein